MCLQTQLALLCSVTLYTHTHTHAHTGRNKLCSFESIFIRSIQRWCVQSFLPHPPSSASLFNLDFSFQPVEDRPPLHFHSLKVSLSITLSLTHAHTHTHIDEMENNILSRSVFTLVFWLLNQSSLLYLVGSGQDYPSGPLLHTMSAA